MSASMTRRDVLAAFLGAPLALAACKRDKRVPDGELALRRDALGHRLRDERPPVVPHDKWQRARVVIIGAGVAGLSAAYRLLERGHDDVVVLELDDKPGGTAQSGASRTSAYPWGAHYITAPMKENTELIALLRRFGLTAGTAPDGEPVFKEQVLCREPEERLFAGGRWHAGLYLREGASSEDLRQVRRFRDLVGRYAATRDARGRRAFAVPVDTSSDDAALTALDRMSAAAWLAREGFTSARLRWMIDYACRDDFGARPEHVSAWAAIHYHAARLIGPGREPQPVLTWPEGNGWLVARLYERVRAKVRTGLAAVDVAPVTRDGREGVDVVAIGRAPACAGIHAERVIVAAPQFVAQRIVRPYRDAPPAFADAFGYGAWMVANITLSGRPRRDGMPERIMAWDNVLRDSPSLGYVVATHQTCRDDGPTVLTYYYPLPTADPREGRRHLFSAGRDEWADVALTDLETAHPDIRSLATRVDVARWGHAMIRPAPGLLFGGARAKARLPHRNVHFAHTDLSGIALFEEAFHHGTRAADEVLSSLRGKAT